MQARSLLWCFISHVNSSRATSESSSTAGVWGVKKAPDGGVKMAPDGGVKPTEKVVVLGVADGAVPTEKVVVLGVADGAVPTE